MASVLDSPSVPMGYYTFLKFPLSLAAIHKLKISETVYGQLIRRWSIQTIRLIRRRTILSNGTTNIMGWRLLLHLQLGMTKLFISVPGETNSLRFQRQQAIQI